VALFLFLQTRGLFVGWVRALGAAAFASLSAWALIVLMLAVLEPWLIAMARQRAENVLDVSTAVTTASIVFVFAASQAALVIAGGVIALGFRLNLARRAPAREAAPRPEPASSHSVSRAEHLAEWLRREGAVITGTRMGATATAARATRTEYAQALAPRIGDAGRRSAISREALAR
jgi:type IV secretion system protein VirB6